jgi:hypothetical protein
MAHWPHRHIGALRIPKSPAPAQRPASAMGGCRPKFRNCRTLRRNSNQDLPVTRKSSEPERRTPASQPSSSPGARRTHPRRPAHFTKRRPGHPGRIYRGEIMLTRRRVHAATYSQMTWPEEVPETALRTEEAPTPRSTTNIDELTASPWIGLHYRHEFLLHHRHELLVQQLDD